jgi:hypothetical protein
MRLLQVVLTTPDGVRNGRSVRKYSIRERCFTLANAGLEMASEGADVLEAEQRDRGNLWAE